MKKRMLISVMPLACLLKLKTKTPNLANKRTVTKWLLHICYQISLCLSFNANAQPVSIRPLTIDDEVPNLVFKTVLNSDHSSAKLSDFKSDLLIIDFWSTWCSSCIKKFPHLDSLKKKYAGKLDIVLMHAFRSNDDQQTVEAFLKKYKQHKLPDFSLPIVVGDTLVDQLFPHTMIPHYVWLNSKRKVVAITDAEAFTEANIDRYLSGQPLDLPLKEDILDYNPAQPLFNYNNGASSRAIIFRSSIAGYLKGLPKGMIRIVKDDGHSRLICINAPVIKIYYQLYGLRYRNRFVLETRRKSLFVSPKGLPDNYRITYELTYAQALTKRQVDNKALKDINNFLQVTTSVEKRLVDCWALVVRDKTKIPVTNGAEAEVDTQDNYKGYKTFTNVSVAGFVATLNTQDFGASAIPIVLDETAFNQHVDFKLKVQGLHNIPDMRLQLQKYGFDLIPVQREMEMLVIKDI